VFTDAWITAKIIDYDRSEIDQLKADVQELKAENTQLRNQVASRPATTAAMDEACSRLDEYMRLERTKAEAS
jgi:outer membrane murein-binding lipoprotein Lpp